MPGGHKFRITGGTHKGHVLSAPKNLRTRPMQGFLREALFNILGPQTVNASVLDLFSGTGSIGLEALSRGASHCAFFESYLPAVKVLKNNIRSFGFGNITKVFHINLLQIKEFPRTGKEPYDLIFLDPPFSFHEIPERASLDRIVQLIYDQGIMSENVSLILQVRKQQKPPVGSVLPPVHFVTDCVQPAISQETEPRGSSARESAEFSLGPDRPGCAQCAPFRSDRRPGCLG